MKRIYVKFDINFICKKLLRDQLDLFGLEYTLLDEGEVILEKELTAEQRLKLERQLIGRGIYIVDKGKGELVHRIKEAINTLLESDEAKRYNLSTYLSERLNYSYAHLSKVFSETTYSSIENFFILKKIDHAKFLLLNENLTLTEVAHRLNYSSVSHLSSQFKKTTGISPTTFQQIIKKRRIARDNTNANQ